MVAISEFVPDVDAEDMKPEADGSITGKNKEVMHV